MVRNIWRYSHFALAVSSSLFVLLATLTGLILAFEPIQTQLQPHKVVGGEECSLSDLIRVMVEGYDEILEIEVDANYFVKASVISMEESKDGDFYINTKSGEKLADIPNKNPFFEWTTNFHRSLFFKTPGRIFVGITSFLLFLIALTGFLLFVKRQKGLIHIFDKVIKEDFAQYYHVIFGRLMLLPIIIITLTGVYLSLFRFSLIPESEGLEQVYDGGMAEVPVLTFSEFEVFKTTKLKEVQKLEFPFSEDIEDPFILTLKNRELQINQKTGAIISETTFPFVNILTRWSFNLHTGTGSIWWSIILLIACINILFFMYSGGMISYRRLRSKVKNAYQPDEAEIVILIGSENGSTRDFGIILQNALNRIGKKIFLDDLNNYQQYPKLEHLLILTSTYGDGDPPANATRFLGLLERNNTNKAFDYAVVGFGSRSYPNFCQFALDIDANAYLKKYANQLTPLHLIDGKSYSSFKDWAALWSNKAALKIELPDELKRKKEKLYPFEIVSKKTAKDGFDETFLLKLKTSRKFNFRSGDLLSVYPPNENAERLYSIGKDAAGNILLSIKRHEFGKCSNFLNEIPVNKRFKAALRRNVKFHVPSEASSLMLIANGTGIAPFLGMVQEITDIPIQLFWGGRTAEAFDLYEELLKDVGSKNQNLKIDTILSKEGTSRGYVQHLLEKNEELVINALNSRGVLMICGSTAMQKGALALLEKLLSTHSMAPLDLYIEKGQILMDCY